MAQENRRLRVKINRAENIVSFAQFFVIAVCDEMLWEQHSFSFDLTWINRKTTQLEAIRTATNIIQTQILYPTNNNILH